MEPAMHLVGTASFCCPPRAQAAAFSGSSFLTVTTPHESCSTSQHTEYGEKKVGLFVSVFVAQLGKPVAHSGTLTQVLPVEKSQAKDVSFGAEL